MDYLAYYFNATAFAMSVEKLLDLEVPERAQYLRVIHMELNRIASHLFWLGTGALDLGAMSMLWWALRDRDMVLDLFEMVTGQRMHPRYGQVGGVAEDIPKGFEPKARQFISYMRGRVGEYEDLIGQNPIWRSRTVGVGVMPPEFAIQMAQSGPNVRASGIPWDLRTANGGYGAYRELDYQPVLGQNGDVFDRFWVRVQEMRSSLDLIEKCLDGLPEGPVISDDRKVVLPPRHELHTSMESLIHHFKLVTEGYRVPAGEAYACVEGPRGELGCNLVSDGSAKPWRVHFRSASLVMLQSVAALCKGVLLADLIAILASLDPNMGDCDR
jgi:NADH-quinone oxidoreductase subunit D